MKGNIRVQFNSHDLQKLTNENLFLLLDDLQSMSYALMKEGWRRGIQVELAQHAMGLKVNESK